MVKLTSDKKEQLIVRAKNIKEGQIAVIIDDRVPEAYNVIIHKHCGNLYPIGTGDSVSLNSSCDAFVRILEDGESITVFDNQL